MFYISVNNKQIYKPLDDLLVLFNPKLTLEIGKAGSLEFDIPPNNPFYDQMNQLTTEVSVDMDDEEIFHGRILSSERTFNNIRHIYCEGDLAYLIDSVQKGSQYSGTTHNLFSQIIASHNARVDPGKRFTVGTVNVENRPIVIVGQSDGENINTGQIDYKQIAINSIVGNWNTTYDYIQTCLIDYCGGYLRTRRNNGTLYIDYLSDYNNNAVQPIELGRNLLDLTEELSVEDLFTVLIPLGDDNLTIASVNGGSDELVNEAAVSRYGRIVRTHVFNNVNSASTLLENAGRFMQTSMNIPRTITVRAIDLHLINHTIPAIKIGDKVEITSFVHEVNDILTCTKIEYDLEKPENNNYTFGNPKQTLTQRYREDVRHDNDIYGNSAYGGSAGSAAVSSAGVVGEAAELEQEDALRSFYDSWVDWQPGQPEVSIGALARDYYNGKEVLLSQCGIDLDGTTGNLNIYSIHNQVDALGNTLSTNEARITAIETDRSVTLEQITQRINEVSGVEQEHYTEIKQTSSNLGSSIESLARETHESINGVTQSLASITQLATDQESRINATAEYVRTVDGKTDSTIASITMVANELGSEIRLKANKTYVDGELNAIIGNFEKLTSGTSVASKLRATEIVAGSLSYWDSASEMPVAVPSMNHSHQLVITEGNDGNVEVRLGMATTVIPQVQSFNIADTKFYRDHVEAVGAASIESLTPDSYSTTGDYTVTFDNAFVRYTDKQIVGRIRITLGNNDIQTAVVQMAGNRAYDAGVDYGAETATATRVNIGTVSNITHDSEDDIWYGTVNVSATAQGTRANGSTYTSSRSLGSQQINVTAAYEAGLAAGSGQAASDVTATVTMNGSQIPGAADNAYITANASLTNGKTASGSYSIYLDAVTNTASAVTMQVKHGSTVLATKTITPISDAGDVTATVNMGYAQIPGVSDNANITATAALSNGANAAGSYSIYLDNTTNTESAVTMQLKHGSTVILSKTVTPVHPSVTASVSMSGSQIPGAADNANITATATLSNGGTASGSYSVFLETSTNTTSSVIVQLKHGSTILASKIVTPTHPSITASVSMSGAQVPSAAANATITATATLSNGTTASDGYSIYLESVTNTSSAVTMQVAHGIGSNKVILASKTVTPEHPDVTATVSMSYAQIPGAPDNANITASASLSNGGTASGSYSIFLDAVTNTASAVTMQVKHGSTVIATKTVTPTHPSVTASVSMSGAQIPGAADNANITATAALSNGGTASGSYSIYLESVTNTASAVTMQVAHGSGSSKVVLATKTVTPTSSSVTASVSMSGAQVPSAAANANITATASLSNGVSASNSYSIYIESVTNTASAVTMQVAHGSGSSKVVLATKTVTPTHPSVTASVSMSGSQIPSAADNANITATASLSNGVSASNSYSIYIESVTNTASAVTMQVAHGSGSSKVVLASKTVTPVSASGTVTLSKASTSSSVNPYYGILSDYAWINNRHYCRINAVATGTANSTQYYDINDIVNYAYTLGGGGNTGPSYSSMTLYCVSRSENGSGLIQLSFSAGSYSNLPFYQGNSYTVYY